MRAKLLFLFFAVFGTGALLSAQQPTSRSISPRIFIHLPASISSDSVWIKYLVIGLHGGYGDQLRSKSHVQQYVIYTSIPGGPAQYARIVAYAPGCQFQIYTPVLYNASDISISFRCIPLTARTLHGYLLPGQIPKPVYSPAPKKLDIVAELEDDWVCGFFLRPQANTGGISAGSCLSAGIPLGTVGEIDPGKQGYFEISIPDFTRDPVFNGTPQVLKAARFGVIELGLRDTQFHRQWGAIRPIDLGPERGLPVRENYPDPVKFTAQ